MADVSHLDATSRTIVGWQVASEMTVLSLFEVARLRRGAFPGGLSFSLDRAHFDAGREDRASGGHAPGRARRGSLRRATGRATTPHAGEPERLLSSRARRRSGTRGRKGRLSPQGRDHVVVHVVEEPGYRALSERLSRRPEPTTPSGPTRHKTTPRARKESTVRSLQGSQGELASVDLRRKPWLRARLPDHAQVKHLAVLSASTCTFPARSEGFEPPTF
jgi:hypothetical protein